ncbi:MAG TPA: hypothetical protein VHS56_03125 [Candidatus Cybelea sp.]|nr:hypothetical protein [Candidatus Cybelea sp.]
MRVAVIGTMIVALAGCAVTRQAVLNSSALPAAGAAGARGAHARTWMRQDAKASDLVYTSDFEGNVYVYTFPALKLAGELTGLSLDILGLCSDAKGHVFIPQGLSAGGEVLEFEHGGTTPIATIPDSYRPQECAVDPTTGDLAVTNVEGSYAADVAVYANLKKAPAIYRDPNIGYFWSVGYDNAGNLFADGQNSDQIRRFAGLPKGAAAFTDISVDAPLRLAFAVQWDGQYVTVARMPARQGTARIERLQVTGSSATVVGTTRLSSSTERFDGQTAIVGNLVVQPYSRRLDRLGIWPYPGGKAMTASVDIGTEINGVAVSAAGRR